MTDTGTVALAVVQTCEVVLTATVAGLLASRWRRARSVATAAAFAVFAVTATIVLTGLLRLSGPQGRLPDLADSVLICLLLAIPPLLVLLAASMTPVSRRWWGLTAGLFVAEVLLSLALTPHPDPGEVRPRGYGLYVVFVLAAWTAQSLIAAVAFWRAGATRSSVVRKRMRSLAGGAALLAATLLLSGAAGENEEWVVFTVGATLLGLLSLVLLAIAFLLPASLRTLWRQEDLTTLAAAERGLMSTLTPAQVGGAVLPALVSTFGGQGAALLTADGRVQDSLDLTEAQLSCVAESLRHVEAEGVVELTGPFLAARLSAGWLIVGGGGLARLFGDDEAQLLDRVATTVDLALQRTALFAAEQDSRRSAEASQQELEVLLYSVSHDLRSPLISVLGYLDVLRQEHGAELPGESRHYLDRMAVNAVYMQELISDLLELSRVGRPSPTPATPLDLGLLTGSVLEGARLTSPAAVLRVEGPMPVVRVDDVRARQLLTNLVDNAVRHGGREDVEVVVSSSTTDSGEVHVRVADDGVGIAPEYRERVLRVFERLGAPKSSPGTGMGLAICKRIAESLGGDLHVEGPSGTRATGTTMRLVLPASVVVRGVPTPRTGGLTPVLTTPEAPPLSPHPLELR